MAAAITTMAEMAAGVVVVEAGVAGVATTTESPRGFV
jgi:hypothetical protein